MTIYPVHLVGAGPGNADLLTLKAARILQHACDVVVYDRLVGPGILELLPSNAERVYAGKSPAHHTMTQDEINATLLRYAKDGKKVVRLKGGDPLLYGRGGEEAEFLQAHGVPCEIVPGITAIGGLSAALKLPLTHRGVATSLRIITGHTTDGEPEFSDWNGLADPATTLVIYMGLSYLSRITENLMRHGMPAKKPAMIVQDATLPSQRVVITTVETMVEDVRKADLRAPSLIVIGNVVTSRIKDIP